LMLEINGLDMAGSFDTGWMDRAEIGAKHKQIYSTWKNALNVKLTDTPQETTTLKRTVSGDFTVYVMEGSGELSPTVLGSLTSASDKTEFSFNHLISGVLFPDMGGTDTVADKVTSNNINIATHEWAGTAIATDGANHAELNGDVNMPIGTVWRPLDNEPKIIIYAK